MSTPARSRSSTPLQPTRQQLDELIELMQRMLALPESAVEEDPNPRFQPPTRLPQRMSPDVPAPVGEPSTNVQAELPGPRPPAQLSDLPERKRPDPLPVGEAVAVMSVSLVPVPASAPATVETDVRDRNPKPIRRTADEKAKRFWTLASQIPSSCTWLWPLVGINRAFDRCGAWLGAPGHWLRGPRGRTWLGRSGLVLLLAALAGYLLLGMGWTW